MKNPSTTDALASTSLSSSSPAYDLSFFDGLTDTTPKHKPMPWPEFVAYLKALAHGPARVVDLPPDPVAAQKGLRGVKERQRTFAPAVFDGKRSKANTRTVSMFVADLDDVTQEEADELLAELRGSGHAFVAWTTWSHGWAKPCAWRVVVLLSAAVEAEAWPHVWRALNDGLFNGRSDESTRDPSRMFLLPVRPAVGVCKDGARVETDPVTFIEHEGAPFGVGPTLELAREALAEEQREEQRREAERAARPVTDQDARRRDGRARAALEGEADKVRNTPAGQGERNRALHTAALKVGGYVKAGDLDESMARDALFSAADANGYARDHGRVETIGVIDAGFRAADTAPALKERPRPAARAELEHEPVQFTIDGRAERAHKSFMLTETGNAERFAHRFGHVARYSYELERWFVWNAQRWVEDKSGEVERMGKTVVRDLYQEAADLDDDKRASLAKWAAKSETATARANMLRLAHSENGLQIRVADLDKSEWLLNVENGTVDLKTGELLAHDRAHMLTKLSPTRYGRGARAPLWEKFLARVLPEADVRAFVQRLIGYALTGAIRENVFPVFWGTGSNGKSVFVEAVRHAMGADYAGTINPQILLHARGQENDDERATLALLGKRLCIASETKDQRRLNEALVKKITGGDTLRARSLYQEAFDFRPTHKVILCTNHRPELGDTSHGIRRRVLLVPWTVTIPEAEQDPTLSEKLKAEAPGILAWAVEGCLAWQAGGLAAPASVKAATDEYFQAEDTLAAFLDDECVVKDGERCKATPLFDRYRQWASENGAEELTQKRFVGTMKERGFVSNKSDGTKVWRGLRLVDPIEKASAQNRARQAWGATPSVGQTGHREEF